MDKVKFAAFLTICCLLASCGYRFVTETTLPAGLKTLHVQILANKSGEPGIETIFTNDIIFEFTRAGRHFVAERNTAEGVLTGTVTSVSYQTVAQRNTQVSLERLAICYIDLKLSDRNGAVVWSAQNLSGSESFYVIADNKLATEKNQKDAIRILSRRLSETIFYRLTDNF